MKVSTISSEYYITFNDNIGVIGCSLACLPHIILESHSFWVLNNPLLALDLPKLRRHDGGVDKVKLPVEVKLYYLVIRVFQLMYWHRGERILASSSIYRLIGFLRRLDGLVYCHRNSAAVCLKGYLYELFRRILRWLFIIYMLDDRLVYWLRTPKSRPSNRSIFLDPSQPFLSRMVLIKNQLLRLFWDGNWVSYWALLYQTISLHGKEVGWRMRTDELVHGGSVASFIHFDHVGVLQVQIHLLYHHLGLNFLFYIIFGRVPVLKVMFDLLHFPAHVDLLDFLKFDIQVIFLSINSELGQRRFLVQYVPCRVNNGIFLHILQVGHRWAYLQFPALFGLLPIL